MKDILELVPKDKCDLAAVEALKTKEPEQVAPILGALLAWIQDINWPVAQELVKILPTHHVGLVPHIVNALESEDDIWKNWILVMLKGFPAETIRTLEPSIKRIAQSPTESERVEETNLYAIRVIKKFGL